MHLFDNNFTFLLCFTILMFYVFVALKMTDLGSVCVMAVNFWVDGKFDSLKGVVHLKK